MAEAHGGDRKKKAGLLRRLSRLVLLLALATGVGLVAGFRIQDEVDFRGEHVDAGKWAWEDTDAFVKYSKHWGDRACALARDVRGRAQQVDQAYGVSEKAGAAASAVADRASALAQRVRGGDPEAVDVEAEAGDPAAERAAERAENLGYTAAELEQLPEGFFDELKAGREAYEGAKQAYAGSHEGMPGWEARLREAKEGFEAAHSHLARALELYPDDARILRDLHEIQTYLSDCSKRMAVTY